MALNRTSGRSCTVRLTERATVERRHGGDTRLTPAFPQVTMFGIRFDRSFIELAASSMPQPGTAPLSPGAP